MRFTFITVHPDLAKALSSEGLLKKAIQKKYISVDVLNPRDFADPPHFRVDDKPFGGGAGMLLKVEPIVRALRSIDSKSKKMKTVVLAPRGRRFTQAKAKTWSRLDHLVFICGRYEGVDQRVADFYADEEIRVGDSVCMGGELAAGIILESVARLIPSVIGNPASLEEESMSAAVEIEYAQYTRPRIFEGHSVPEALVSGNHLLIKEWKKLHQEKS